MLVSTKVRKETSVKRQVAKIATTVAISLAAVLQVGVAQAVETEIGAPLVIQCFEDMDCWNWTTMGNRMGKVGNYLVRDFGPGINRAT